MPKPIDVTKLSKDGLQNLIKNYRDRNAADEANFRDAVVELEGRIGKGLNFEKSKAAIRSAAKERRFLSYKDLADESSADWSKVRYEVGGHLWRLISDARDHGMPMLSAIVVNKPNVGTGKMEPETLKGFIAAAKALGHTVTDEEAFLRDQQDAVFAWGSGSSSGP